MSKKIIALIAIALILTAGLFAFSLKSDKGTKNQSCCKKSTQQCREEEKKQADDIILENISRQFIVITPSGF